MEYLNRTINKCNSDVEVVVAKGSECEEQDWELEALNELVEDVRGGGEEESITDMIDWKLFEGHGALFMILFMNIVSHILQMHPPSMSWLFRRAIHIRRPCFYLGTAHHCPLRARLNILLPLVECRNSASLK